MKLVRFGALGQEKPGLIDQQGNLRDLSAIVSDIDSKLLGGGGLEQIKTLDEQSLPLVEGEQRFAKPIATVGKCICVGLNYADHAAESGMEVPIEPVLFAKATSSLQGANDDVILPPASEKSDWEVELAVVIGKEARYVAEEDAMDHVAGLCVMNDLSERAYQLEKEGQWMKGKGCDTFGPLGPYLVTTDESGDGNNRKIWLEVNGKRVQDGNTNTMVYKVPFLVSYISQFMSLQPGDVISTGTPPGVGLGFNPPVYLKKGDVMRLGIEGLGEQQQIVKQ